jgi:hypothetical protein
MARRDLVASVVSHPPAREGGVPANQAASMPPTITGSREILPDQRDGRHVERWHHGCGAREAAVDRDPQPPVSGRSTCSALFALEAAQRRLPPSRTRSHPVDSLLTPQRRASGATLETSEPGRRDSSLRSRSGGSPVHPPRAERSGPPARQKDPHRAPARHPRISRVIPTSARPMRSSGGTRSGPTPETAPPRADQRPRLLSDQKSPGSARTRQFLCGGFTRLGRPPALPRTAAPNPVSFALRGCCLVSVLPGLWFTDSRDVSDRNTGHRSNDRMGSSVGWSLELDKQGPRT